MQATDRALLVDILPPSLQAAGNAWAGRMFGLGSVAGFFIGGVNLPKILPWLGRTQLEVLCVVSSTLLLVFHGITAGAVEEKVLVMDGLVLLFCGSLLLLIYQYVGVLQMPTCLSGYSRIFGITSSHYPVPFALL